MAVSYETVRCWCLKFGQTYANALHRRRPQPGDKQHLDEAYLAINRARRNLWWAADVDGELPHASRRRERAVKGFRSVGGAPRFLTAFNAT